tara:strand:+ start:20 stop:304 length:285 start_codon:yes stop_codon:yes gene_type:complete
MTDLDSLIFASCMFFLLAGLIILVADFIIINFKKRKENGRANKQGYIRVNQKRKGETYSDTEVSENQISNKSKYRRAKEKAINSKKVKKNARKD